MGMPGHDDWQFVEGQVVHDKCSLGGKDGGLLLIPRFFFALVILLAPVL